MSDKHDIDIFRLESEARQPVRQTLLLCRLWWSKRKRLIPIVAAFQCRIVDLAVITSDVIQDSTVQRFDQVGKYGCLDKNTLPTAARGQCFLVTMSSSENWPKAANERQDLSSVNASALSIRAASIRWKL